MTARVLAVLLFCPDETITAGEIADNLDANPGTISTAIRALERGGLVERVPRPGRREHFRFPEDGWVRMLSEHNQAFAAMAVAARSGLAAVEEDSPPGRRLSTMASLYDHLRVALPRVLAEWQEKERERRSGDER